MAYGTIKVDTITFTNAGSDQSITVSGIVQSISGNITATGTIQGQTIIGTSTVSGAIVTGDAGLFTTLTGSSAGFTTLTGGTVTGTTANFNNGTFTSQISGTTVTGNIAQFTTLTGGAAGFTSITGATVTGTTANFNNGTFTSQISGTTVTGNIAQFTTLTGGAAGFTSITGATVTGTTANFVTVSGNTVTGNAGQFTTITGGSAGFTSITGATVTGTVANFGAGSAAAPAVSVGTTDNGIYSPGTDQLALSTNGAGRLVIDASGNVGINNGSPTTQLTIGISNNATVPLRLFSSSATNSIEIVGRTTNNRNIVQFYNANGITSQFRIASTQASTALFQDLAADLRFGTNALERLRITSAGLVGIGTSVPSTPLEVAGAVGNGVISDYLSLYYPQSYGGGASGPRMVFKADDIAGTKSTYAGIWSLIQTNGVGSHSGKLVFGTTSGGSLVERLRIDESGNVGIGTTSPSQALQVNGDIRLGATSTTDEDVEYQITSGGQIAIRANNASTQNNNFVGLSLSSGVSPNQSAITIFGSANSAFHDIRFSTNSAERARIDSSGRLLVGTSSARSDFFNNTVSSGFQLEGVGASPNNRYLSVVNNFNSAGGGGATIALGRSKGTVVGSDAQVSSNDQLGRLDFQGADGTNLVSAASIEAYVDAGTGTGDMPGRLVFSTTADGASTPTERMRIDSAGTTTITSSTSTAPFIAKINTSEVARIDSSGRLLVGTSTGQYRLTVNTNLTAASGEKHFLIQTGNHVQVKRDFDTAADTSLVVLNAGAAGNSTQGAWEVTIFGTGFKSGVSDNRQHYQKWYVSRDNTGTFSITSAFSSGTSGMFTLTSSGNELRVRNAFSVVGSGNIVVDITGFQGHRDGVAETDWMANVTMP